MAQYHFHHVLLVNTLLWSGNSLHHLVGSEALANRNGVLTAIFAGNLPYTWHLLLTWSVHWENKGYTTICIEIRDAKIYWLLDKCFFLVTLYKLFNKCYSKLFSLKVNLQVTRLVWYFRHFSNFSFLEKCLLWEKFFFAKVQNQESLSSF